LTGCSAAGGGFNGRVGVMKLLRVRQWPRNTQAKAELRRARPLPAAAWSNGADLTVLDLTLATL
jgi:hypothetical protein